MSNPSTQKRDSETGISIRFVKQFDLVNDKCVSRYDCFMVMPEVYTSDVHGQMRRFVNFVLRKLGRWPLALPMK